ncbi:MAG: MSHA pilin protein MshC [Oleispira sp.]|jgi:MSHA pilin protein MshC
MKNYQQGFTLIELITVIILLGILSAFAVSRFPSSQRYSTAIITNQLIASLRLAQQTALSRASVDSVNHTQLNVTGDSDHWSLVVSSGSLTYNAQVGRDDEEIRFGSNLTGSCSALSTAPLTVTFDGNGNRVPAQNLRVCIDSFTDIELCISSSGYAYEGNCIP